MDISNNVWQVYPDDAPGLVGREIPGSRIFCHRMVWRPDAASAAGQVVHLKDAKGRDVFFHVLPATPAQHTMEFAGPLNGPLTLESLDSGVLEVVIE